MYHSTLLSSFNVTLKLIFNYFEVQINKATRVYLKCYNFFLNKRKLNYKLTKAKNT